MEPGIYYDLNYADYDAIDAVRSSHAKSALLSAADYLAATTEPSKDSAARKRGRAIHTAVLEPLKFLDDYVMFLGSKVKDPNGWKQFQADHAAKCILTPEEYADAKAAAAAVKASPVATALLGKPGTRHEVSIVWDDATTGLRCKARLDCLTDGEYPDVKSTRDARNFVRQARGYRRNKTSGEWQIRYGSCAYDFQAAFHGAGLAALGLIRSPVWIVVQTTAPVRACVRRPDAALLALGRQQVESALATIAECKASGQWPWLADDELVEAEDWETESAAEGQWVNAGEAA